jgi:hypothetical protein
MMESPSCSTSGSPAIRSVAAGSGGNKHNGSNGRAGYFSRFLAYLWQSKASVLIVFCCLLSIFTSVYGIKLAVEKYRPSDGGRGGAIGVTIALVILFINRNSVRIYQLRSKVIPALIASIRELTGGDTPQENIRVVRGKLDSLEKMFSAKGRDQVFQNIFIVLATAIGTIVWGFGDLFAQWLIDHPLSTHHVIIRHFIYLPFVFILSF